MKKFNKHILLVGPLPNKIFSGTNLPFKLLVDHCISVCENVRVVNISSMHNPNGSFFSLKRSLEYVIILISYFKNILSTKKNIYITISQSKKGFFRDMIMIVGGKLFNHHIICHLHGGNFRNFYIEQNIFMKSIIRFTYRKVDVIIVYSEKLKSMFDFDASLKQKLKIVYNGLTFNMDKNHYKELPKVISEPVQLLYLSNLIESKGYFDLLKAVNILNRENNLNIIMHVCGMFICNKPQDITVKNEKQAKNQFFSFIKDNGLCDIVRYHGNISGEDKSMVLKNSHIFVLPTYYLNEGQPVSIIEAMAYGNVVLSTDYRAIPEMVINKKTGLYIQKNNPNSIVEKILYLVNNPEEYKRLSAETIKHFNKHFTKEKHLNDIMSILLVDYK